MMRTVLVAVMVIIQCGLAAQNLITNSSFEDTIPISLNPNYGGPESAPPWFVTKNCGGSPDYLSSTYYFPIVAIPYNTFGYEPSKTGNAYCGFMPVIGSIQNYREMLSHNLSVTLISTHKYFVSYFVSIGDNADVAVDSLGFFFDRYTRFCLGLIYQPQIVSGNGT
ncbi:MAG: hypothetical protein IPP29_07495 [Bacteroidetes bacterium]|nr:hypothetical protein [Bacteroidota bacterium]